MTAPPIAPLHSPVPNPNQGRVAFNANKQLWMDSEQLFSASLDAFGSWIGETAVSVTALAGAAAESEGSAQTAANIAMAVSNIQEDHWPDLTGALPAWSAVWHNSKLWINKVAIPDITAEEPLEADSIWIDYFSLVSAGEVVSSADDVADAKVPNNAWLKSRGIGGSNVLTGVSLNQNFGAGFKSFYLDDVDDGPTANFVGYATHTGTTTGPDYSTMEVTDAVTGEKYFRIVINGSYGAWVPVGSGTSSVNFIDLGDVAVSAGETVDLDLTGADLSGNTIFLASMNGSNTTGNLTLTISNQPATPWAIHLFVMRPGRKNIVWPAGWLYNQGQTPPLSNTANNYALFHVHRVPSFFTENGAVITLLTAMQRP